METTAMESLGFAHFLTHTDIVGRVVLGLLLLLSLASWYLIVTRALANSLARRRSNAFLQRFWLAKSLTEVRQMEASQAPDNPAANLVHKALEAMGNGNQQSLALAGGLGEYLTRTLNNAVDQEAADSEFGLTVLASAGSAAPYVGLFGTVWGIYHALVQIGMSGQGTLDKVAGPVGEALIMTALGLAVAIPAVLAYNAFNRRNRVWLARLESFSHDLYVLLTVKSGESGDGGANHGASGNSSASGNGSDGRT
jgi:biopolymer transport protein ExbB